MVWYARVSPVCQPSLQVCPRPFYGSDSSTQSRFVVVLSVQVHLRGCGYRIGFCRLHDKHACQGENSRPTPKTTSSKKESEVEKKARMDMSNRMSAACYNLWDPDTKPTDSVFCCFALVWSKWHGLQNKRLRSVEETEPWMREQLQGGFENWGAFPREVHGVRGDF